MEKPDEPSEESKEGSLSKYTCAADPQLGKKPVGKSASLPYFVSVLAAACLAFFKNFFLLLFLLSVLIITVVTCCC